MPLPWLPAAISTVGSMVQGLFQRRSEKKQYEKMLEYNTPKAQMQRYSEAGLSPYLIYGAANAGNANSSKPADYVPDIGKGIDNYMSYANFDQDIKAKRLNNAILAKNLQMLDTKAVNLELTGTNTMLKALRSSLDTLADYPGYSSDDGLSISDKHMAGSFRRKLNELKLSASQAGIERLQSMIQGMKYENVQKRIKAIYAEDYGMVGGDWTQGLGLFKSMLGPRMYRSSGNLTEYQKRILKRYPK